MKKMTDKQAKQMSNTIRKREEFFAQSSCGLVDHDWDRIDDTEYEFAERLRTRGSF